MGLSVATIHAWSCFDGRGSLTRLHVLHSQLLHHLCVLFSLCHFYYPNHSSRFRANCYQRFNTTFTVNYTVGKVDFTKHFVRFTRILFSEKEIFTFLSSVTKLILLFVLLFADFICIFIHKEIFIKFVQRTVF